MSDEALRDLRVGQRRGVDVIEMRDPCVPAATGGVGDGILCDGFIWKYLTLSLSEEWPIVHWHYRGHGRTPEPRDRRRVSMPDLADDLASVLDAAGVARAVLAAGPIVCGCCGTEFTDPDPDLDSDDPAGGEDEG